MHASRHSHRDAAPPSASPALAAPHTREGLSLTSVRTARGPRLRLTPVMRRARPLRKATPAFALHAVSAHAGWDTCDAACQSPQGSEAGLAFRDAHGAPRIHHVEDVRQLQQMVVRWNGQPLVQKLPRFLQAAGNTQRIGLRVQQVVVRWNEQPPPRFLPAGDRRKPPSLGFRAE